jgi:MinD superfamily P-loop ATPase
VETKLLKIAVLSGKGGTGKTFVSVNLAYSIGKSVYVDCDVEEPNGRLFFKPLVNEKKEINVIYPKVDNEKCNGCRICSEFCKFNALAYIKENLLVFPELCHNCKGCLLLCPENALNEEKRNIGFVEKGKSEDVKVNTGFLNIGEASGVPIINELIDSVKEEKECDAVVIDCPPGSSCTVMDSIKEADYCIIVTEPTAFGIHNSKMVLKLVKLFEKPYSIVLNKGDGDEKIVKDFLDEEHATLLENFKFDLNLAKINSDGLIAAKEDREYYEKFKNIFHSIKRRVSK